MPEGKNFILLIPKTCGLSAIQTINAIEYRAAALNFIRHLVSKYSVASKSLWSHHSDEKDERGGRAAVASAPRFFE
jgi:hypothetical protein